MSCFKNKGLLAIVFAVIIVSSLSAILFLIDKDKQEAKKPPPQTEPSWYIRFSVKDQKSTAYVESPQAEVSASGSDYFIGAVAVHPLYPGTSPLEPIVPFGTTIFLEKPINVQGKEYRSFIVTDTGDIYYGRYGSYPYWFDIYWGHSNYYNHKQARDYGSRLVDYYWFEKWK